MNESTPAAGDQAPVPQPLEITTFYPEVSARRPEPRLVRRYASSSRLEDYRGVAIALFLATCLSVFGAGLAPGGGFYPEALGKLYFAFLERQLPQVLPEMLREGAIYFGAVMTILVAHEMGHYLQSRRYKVPATFPFFIPMPISPFGTMGAVIIQGPGVADRKSLFDIAISGPLAGLVFALPITWIGLLKSHVGYVDPAAVGHTYGDPLLLKWMARLVHGPIPEHYDVMLNSWLFAGWVGMFITALNLMPIGQLDGGHILYTLIGRRAHRVALLLLAVALGFMIWYREYAYGIMVALLFLSGPRHPPTANDEVSLGPGRIVLGWLTLAFVIIGFTPFPISFQTPTPPPPKLQRQQRERPVEPGELLQVWADRPESVSSPSEIS
jgi:Zn-dependent protease